MRRTAYPKAATAAPLRGENVIGSCSTLFPSRTPNWNFHGRTKGYLLRIFTDFPDENTAMHMLNYTARIPFTGKTRIVTA